MKLLAARTDGREQLARGPGNVAEVQSKAIDSAVRGQHGLVPRKLRASRTCHNHVIACARSFCRYPLLPAVDSIEDYN